MSMTMQKKVNLEGKLAKSVHEDDHDAHGDGDDDDDDDDDNDDDDDDHDVANLEAKSAPPCVRPRRPALQNLQFMW